MRIESGARKPPQILQIVQEILKEGAEQAYGKVEEALAKLCKRMGCPNRYLALVSDSLPREVWWLNTYDSQADVDRIRQAYANNPELTDAMRGLVTGKEALTSAPTDLMTTLRPDLSDAAPWQVGELRFAVVLETQTPAKRLGMVFEATDGRAFVIAAAATRKNAEGFLAVLGPAARLFEVRPEWSFPYHGWVARNPGLWKSEQ